MFLGKKPKRPPLVIVTGPDRFLRFGWWATWFQLWRVGLRSVYVTPKNNELPDETIGIVIGGGDDIDPAHYGASGSAGANYDVDRDIFELDVINLALKKRIPMLGICRGAQLINVACGGNLIQDLRSRRIKTPNRNSIFPIKTARISPNTRLNSILGKTKIKVNSLHHQAIDALGDNLNIAALDDDGFIQAIESTNKQFIIGVQWHPEYMPQKASQTLVFRALAQEVSECAGK